MSKRAEGYEIKPLIGTTKLDFRIQLSMTLDFGANCKEESTEFRVWAPGARSLIVQRVNGAALEMNRGKNGDYYLSVPARAGERYFYQADQHTPVPDPVSRLLPEGVHGPTEIVDPSTFFWTDQNWRGLPLRDYIIYELHVGTFTSSGTFAGAVEKLDYLQSLGITTIELMPVAAFPGRRNWGYDGVSPYAVHAGYGGSQELKRLVNAAHAAGLAVLVDVVYNHLGNEGNYLRRFGPYFTDRYKTPWGEAINFDGPGSEGVRRYFVENALYWISEYHLDGLRLDAIQTIHDDSPRHIVAEISERIHRLADELGREVCVIAETDENDARYLQPGFNLDAVWSDDFHHTVHALLTGEREGYYQDFGQAEQILRALNEGFVFQGEHFQFWNAPRGTKPDGVPLPAHVIALQNHDQVGNRARGERLSHLVPRGARHMAAALLLLAPHTPLLFMGEEYDETAPFQFFTDYGDPQLQKAVSEGRRREFRQFRWEDVPDPQDPATFLRSKLHWDLAVDGNPTLRWYRDLIALRKQYVTGGERTCRATLRDRRIVLEVPREQPRIMVIGGLPGRASDIPASRDWKLEMENEEDGYVTKVYAAKRVDPLHS